MSPPAATCVRLSTKGSDYKWFVQRLSAATLRSSAHDGGRAARGHLEDALRIALLVCEHEPARTERAAGCGGSALQAPGGGGRSPHLREVPTFRCWTTGSGMTEVELAEAMRLGSRDPRLYGGRGPRALRSGAEDRLPLAVSDAHRGIPPSCSVNGEDVRRGSP